MNITIDLTQIGECCSACRRTHTTMLNLLLQSMGAHRPVKACWILESPLFFLD